MTAMTESQRRVLELLSDRTATVASRTLTRTLGEGAARSAASLVRHGWAVCHRRRVGRTPVSLYAITEAGVQALAEAQKPDRCAECLHDHDTLIEVVDGEFMCQWCLYGDYDNDPLTGTRVVRFV